MLRVLVSVDIDEPTKMAASATLRRAFLSSTVDIRSWTIHAIDGVEDHTDAQLSLIEAVCEVDEDDNLCADCGHVTRFDDTACKGCGQLTEHGEFVAGGGNAAVQTDAVV